MTKQDITSLPIVQDWREDIIDSVEKIIKENITTDDDKEPFFDVIFNDYEEREDENIPSIDTPYYYFKYKNVGELNVRNNYGNDFSVSGSFGGTRIVDFSVYICFPDVSFPLKDRMKNIIDRVRELQMYVGNKPFNSTINITRNVEERLSQAGVRVFAECVFRVEVMESYSQVFELADIQEGSVILKNGKTIIESIQKTMSLENYYTKQEVDSLLAKKAEVADVVRIDKEILELSNKVNGFDNRIKSVESGLATLGVSVTAVKQDIVGIKTNITGIETNVTNLGTKVDGIDGDLTILENYVTGLDTIVKGVIADVDTIKPKVDKNTIDIADVRSDIIDINTNIDKKADKTEIARLETEIGKKANITDVDALGVKVDTNTTSIGSIETSITDISNSIVLIDGKIDKVENDIVGINTEIGDINTTLLDKADRTEVNDLADSVTSLEGVVNVVSGKVDTNTLDIAGLVKEVGKRALQTDLDALTLVVGNKVDKVDFNKLEVIVSKHSTDITSINGTLGTKADKSITINGQPLSNNVTLNLELFKKYGLGENTVITKLVGVDLDTANISTGFYSINNAINVPVGITDWFYLISIEHDSFYKMQMIIELSGTGRRMFVRTKIGTPNWNSWRAF